MNFRLQLRWSPEGRRSELEGKEVVLRSLAVIAATLLLAANPKSGDRCKTSDGRPGAFVVEGSGDAVRCIPMGGASSSKLGDTCRDRDGTPGIWADAGDGGIRCAPGVDWQQVESCKTEDGGAGALLGAPDGGRLRCTPLSLKLEPGRWARARVPCDKKGVLQIGTGKDAYCELLMTRDPALVRQLRLEGADGGVIIRERPAVGDFGPLEPPYVQPTHDDDPPK